MAKLIRWNDQDIRSTSAGEHLRAIIPLFPKMIYFKPRIRQACLPEHSRGRDEV
ncbi:MAG: hypothetical protein IM613_18320 [Cytophagales bacterium]|nr:hypothetical protein [Cytophagales bacterium]MCA6388960.1 hypothetical protein [Cytophagales bacterium]MCA6414945.1 hypothetical protein [Cytophagales bacterium]MCA6418437.1 hypothetical protein [Cytophagales bacterium]MCA6431394.1 hypothetical protein [Cytophagales bacterium]